MHVTNRSCLSLFSHTPNLHRLLAEHLTAEYRVKTENAMPQRSRARRSDPLLGEKPVVAGEGLGRFG